MAWTRGTGMRVVAMTAALVLVVVHWQDRGPWLWVGSVLLVLNAVGLLRTRRRTVPAAGDTPGGTQRLDAWLSSPGVASAFAAGPRLWRQVSCLDDDLLEPMAFEEIAEFVWIEHDHGWAIHLGDEVKPYLDLDLEDDDDPLLRVLTAHPAVADAFHEDREVYRVEQRGPIPTAEFAELAARALVSHHVHAASAS